MNLIRTLAVLVFAAVIAAPAHADGSGETWRIVESAGTVKAGGAGLTPVAVAPNQALPADAWVETAATGRAILVRGAESIAIGPNSRVQLPKLEVNGNTQVLQTLGSALYQIGKQQRPHFQVDTPYLAAVVKGTAFTVTVDEGTASVQVTEGLVEVATPDRADVEFVRPGFTGVVSRDHRGDVVVVQSQRGAVPPPAKDRASKDKSTSIDSRMKLASLASGSPDTSRVVIANAIGEMKLDIKSVSGGLAFNATEPAGRTVSSTATAKEAGESPVAHATDVLASVGTAVTGVVGEAASVGAEYAATPAVPAVLEVGPISVGIGAGAAPDLGGGSGVSVDVGVGGGSGASGGSGGVSVDAGVGVGGVGVGVGVGVGNGGGGVGISIGLGGGLGVNLGLGSN